MKKLFAYFLIVTLLLFQTAADDTNDIKSILKEIDNVNRYSDSFSAIMKIASYSPDNKGIMSTYQMYSKGQKKVLLVYIEPEKDSGKKIAMNGESLWFYFPRAKQSILIRPINTLTGSVSVGDIIGEPILDLYSFDSSKKSENNTIILTFKAKDIKSPYGKLEYEYKDGKIATQKLYTRSDILLKIISFIEYTTGPSGKYATKIKIQNAVYPEYYSLILLTNLQSIYSIPDYYFTPEGLENAGNYN